MKRQRWRRGSGAAWMREGIRKGAQIGGRHSGDTVESHVHQHVTAIKQNALVVGNCLIRDFFRLHLGQHVEGECPVGPAGVAEASRLHLHPAVVAGVGDRLHVREAVLLEHRSICLVGNGRVRAGFHGGGVFLPSVEIRGKNARVFCFLCRPRRKRDGD